MISKEELDVAEPWSIYLMVNSVLIVMVMDELSLSAVVCLFQVCLLSVATSTTGNTPRATGSSATTSSDGLLD